MMGIKFAINIYRQQKKPTPDWKGGEARPPQGGPER